MRKCDSAIIALQYIFRAQNGSLPKQKKEKGGHEGLKQIFI